MSLTGAPGCRMSTCDHVCVQIRPLQAQYSLWRPTDRVRAPDQEEIDIRPPLHFLCLPSSFRPRRVSADACGERKCPTAAATFSFSPGGDKTILRLCSLSLSLSVPSSSLRRAPDQEEIDIRPVIHFLCLPSTNARLFLLTLRLIFMTTSTPTRGCPRGARARGRKCPRAPRRRAPPRTCGAARPRHP
jgi:hypothetical protein